MVLLDTDDTRYSGFIVVGAYKGDGETLYTLEELLKNPMYVLLSKTSVGKTISDSIDTLKGDMNPGTDPTSIGGMPIAPSTAVDVSYYNDPTFIGNASKGFAYSDHKHKIEKWDVYKALGICISNDGNKPKDDGSNVSTHLGAFNVRRILVGSGDAESLTIGNIGDIYIKI